MAVPDVEFDVPRVVDDDVFQVTKRPHDLAELVAPLAEFFLHGRVFTRDIFRMMPVFDADDEFVDAVARFEV